MRANWAPMFSWWVHDGIIRDVTWRKDALGSPAGKLSALLLYIAMTIKRAEESGIKSVKVTYNRLSEMTGISRELVREGISILERLEMVSIEKSGRNNIYTLINKRESGGWCKIPAKAIISEDGRFITPFKELKLRKRVELHAVKIFLYLASVRDNHSEYSMASYETIRKAIGISDKDVTKALTLLTIIGMLDRVSMDKGGGGKENQPNKYYLAGYKTFFRRGDAISG